MPVYNTHQAKTHLSELIRMVERGEVITITRSNIPVALLTRIGALPQPRRPGTLSATMRLNRMLDFGDGPRRERRPGLHHRGTTVGSPAAPRAATLAADPAADPSGINSSGIDTTGSDSASLDNSTTDT